MLQWYKKLCSRWIDDCFGTVGFWELDSHADDIIRFIWIAMITYVRTKSSTIFHFLIKFQFQLLLSYFSPHFFPFSSFNTPFNEFSFENIEFLERNIKSKSYKQKVQNISKAKRIENPVSSVLAWARKGARRWSWLPTNIIIACYYFASFSMGISFSQCERFLPVILFSAH